jgi:hypothetical protein
MDGMQEMMRPGLSGRLPKTIRALIKSHGLNNYDKLWFGGSNLVHHVSNNIFV